MKYCTKCGAQVEDDALFCPKCGHKFVAEAQAEVVGEPKKSGEPASNSKIKRRDDTVIMIAFVFCILSCVTIGWCLIPLIWMIPMTVSLYNKMKFKEPIGIAFKVLTLLFVSLIGGILLLVGDDSDE